ncbi:MAG: sigma-70 family RNA polymerase sigma factor [Pseudomonadota bacterium]
MASLLRRVAERDRAAFNALYDRTAGKLFGIALRICGDGAAAEDVTQESFVKVWQRASDYSADLGSPLAWMGTIARNTAIDWHRKHNKGETVSDAALDGTPDGGLLADELLEGVEQSAKIKHCMSKLGDDQKSLILEAFFSGFTYLQLATSKGIPLNTVKSRVRRGLKNLRKCLDDE